LPSDTVTAAVSENPVCGIWSRSTSPLPVRGTFLSRRRNGRHAPAPSITARATFYLRRRRRGVYMGGAERRPIGGETHCGRSAPDLFDASPRSARCGILLLAFLWRSEAMGVLGKLRTVVTYARKGWRSTD